MYNNTTQSSVWITEKISELFIIMNSIRQGIYLSRGKKLEVNEG